MHSMTGFGQATAESSSRRIQVSLRAVNHRFLDLVVRLPEECRELEVDLQRRIGERLARGRVELTVDLSPLAGTTAPVEVRPEVARALADAARELSREGVATGELPVAALLALPGVLEVSASAGPWAEEDAERLEEAVDRALDQLVRARREEGERLAVVVRQKLDDTQALARELDRLRPAAQEALLEALQERLTELLADGLPEPERLAQEAALLVEKSNIAEELERLDVHLAHAGEILERPGAIGKRLDFLVQEMFRELNTLSAKCRNSEMTGLCVDAKVLCEELREQLRNVE